MPIRTNMTSLKPRRQAFSREIQLPSRGYTNRDAWPNGRLTVFPWDTGIDSFLFDRMRQQTSRNEVLYSLVEKVCNLNGGKVDDLIASEVNIILLVSRALGSANEKGVVSYDSHCPRCQRVMAETIAIPDELGVVGAKPEDYAGFDVITLPNCKDKVAVKPLKVGDERLVLDRSSDEKRRVDDKTLRTAMAVVTINDSRADTLSELVQYLDALSPTDIAFLETQHAELSPHLDASIAHKCDSCGHEFKELLTFDTEFFRSRGPLEAGSALETAVATGVGSPRTDARP